MGKRDVFHRFHRTGHCVERELISICTGDLRPLVTNSPYFYVSLTAMILGTQMFLAGFIGELISRDSPNRNKYKIETEL